MDKTTKHFFPPFFVLGGCSQINENAPLPWLTMYIDYLGQQHNNTWDQLQLQLITIRNLLYLKWMLANFMGFDV